MYCSDEPVGRTDLIIASFRAATENYHFTLAISLFCSEVPSAVK